MFPDGRPKKKHEEKAQSKEIQQRKRRAQVKSSEESFGSEDYWMYTIEENTADKDLNEFRWKVGQTRLEDTAFERARDLYLERRHESRVKETCKIKRPIDSRRSSHLHRQPT